jgi:hypothetical protein
MHLSPLSPSLLPEILQRATALEVKAAEEGDGSGRAIFMWLPRTGI